MSALMAWGWPQWVMALYFALGFLIAVSHHGKDNANPKINAFDTLFKMGFITAIIAAGGFWS